MDLVFKDEMCHECKKLIPGKEVFREGHYNEKGDYIWYRFFHESCAKIYCDRRKLTEVLQS